MGVYGLMTLLASSGQSQSVESVKGIVKGIVSPKVLIDGPGWSYFLCNSVETMLGGYNGLAQKVQSFVGRMRALGIEPVVFFDGVFRQPKQRAQLMRRQEDVKNTVRLYAELRSTKKQRSNANHSVTLPLLAKEVILEALALLHVECRQHIEEADGLIARYFADNQPSVVGILSNDSDFFVFKDVVFFPIDKWVWLPNGDARCIMWRNEDVARALHVNPNHLSILSCLIGNDYTREMLLKSTVYRQAVLAKSGIRPAESRRMLRSCVAFCNKFLGENVEKNLEIIGSELLKSCLHRSKILLAFREAIKIIHLEHEAIFPVGLSVEFQTSYQSCRVDNSLLCIYEAGSFWNRVTLLGDLDINVIVEPLKTALFSFMTRSDTLIEYLQQGGRFFRERKGDLQRIDWLQLSDFWGKDARYLEKETRLIQCAREIILVGDETAAVDLCQQSDSSGFRLAWLSLRYLMVQNEKSDEEPFLFPWEGFVLLAHLVAKHLGIVIEENLEGLEQEQEKLMTKKVSRLLLQIPVARTISVSAAYQTVLLHSFFALQACNCSDRESIHCFEFSEFNQLYHLFYRHVLLARHQNPSQPWNERVGSLILAEEFVQRLFKDHAKALDLFMRLKEIILEGMGNFMGHFPDEFRIRKQPVVLNSPEFEQAVKKASKRKPNTNPFSLLVYLGNENF